MRNTYTWVISQLDCHARHEGYDNVVYVIHWRRQATDGKGRNAEIYGAQAIDMDPSASFTSYDELEFNQVIGWLESAIGKERLDAQITALDQQIEDQINPPVVRPKLPWGQSWKKM